VLDFSDAPHAGAGYRPPAPVPKPALSGTDGDLLQILSAGFYRRMAVRLRGVDRDVVVINDPSEIKNALSVSVDAFPKSDLMIAALEPLIGDGIFISNGALWRRQRRMLEPALSQMRVRRMYPLMSASVTDFIARLRALGSGAEVTLDSEMSFVALDVIFRTIFSRPVSPDEAAEISATFSNYQDRAPQDAMVALFGDSGAPPIPVGELTEIATGIRSFITRLVDERLSLLPRQSPPDDILQAVIDARDPEDGSAFSREELVNQISVLFLAGHETSASVLTWCFFILSQMPQLAEKIRNDTIAMSGGRPLEQDELSKIIIARDTFREGLRLYPPVGFITRVSTQAAAIGGYDIEAGTLIVISPWLMHRHEKYWKDADIFDPERFSEARERDIVPGTYIPFGLGARVCTGRTIAMIEGPLVIAEVARALRFTPLQPETVTPSFRLTVRPQASIRCKIDVLPMPSIGGATVADGPA
jgi:cytochrome P450